MKKAILFDLDGTLLPLNQDAFLIDYFNKLTNHFLKQNKDAKKIMGALKIALEAMIHNNGEMTNEDRFASVFTANFGTDYFKLEPYFINFYETTFDELEKHSKSKTIVKKIISDLKQKNYQLILATNPVFPQIATFKRIKWAGLNKEDFSLVTTFENSSFCKPNLKYYEEILNKFNLHPDDVIMIGNDLAEDMVINKLGVTTFLLTPYLINPGNENVNIFPNGNYEDLFEYIKKLPKVGNN